MKKDSFIMYNSMRETILELTGDEVKSLILAMFEYNMDEDVHDLDRPVKMAFIPVRQQMDRDYEKYCEISEKRSVAGKKGAGATNSKRTKVGNAENDSTKTANAEFDESIPAKVGNAENDSAKTAEYEYDTEYDSDINKNTHTSAMAAVVRMYNEICTSLPPAKTLSDKRKRDIKARLKKYSLDDFRKLFEKAQASSFLRGDNGKFHASIDWLINEGNFAKTLDGNYDDRPDKQRAAPARAPAAANTRFNNFEQRNYDYQKLEQQLLSSERKDDKNEQTKSMGKPCG